MKIELDLEEILYTRLQKKAKAKKRTVESFIIDKLETVTSYIYLSGGFYYCMEYDRLYNIRHAEIALTKRENKLFKILLHKKGDTVCFDELIHHTWGNKNTSKYSLRNVILKIRAKTSTDIVMSHSGKGYNIPIKQK